MSFAITRYFTYFTLLCYLVVGSFCVRVLAPEMTAVSVSSQYFNLFSKTEISTQVADALTAPEMHFAEIQFPVEKKIVVAKKVVVKPKIVKVAVQKARELKTYTIAKNELPFYEPVVLHSTVMTTSLPQKLASFYVDFEYQKNMVAATSEVNDEVSTKLAANQATDAEPEFFEYETVKEAPKKAEEVPAEKVVENIQQEIPTEVSTETAEVVKNVENTEIVNNSANIVNEEVSIDDMVAFDYSKADADIKKQVMPVVSKVTTQASGAYIPTPEATQSETATVQHSKKSRPAVTTQPEEEVAGTDPYKSNKSASIDSSKIYSNKVTIQISGTNFEKTQSEVGFEVRFQDDLSEAVQDYNSGVISLDQELSRPKMNRAVTVLKLGFAPTNTDLILEDGETELSIPMIEDSVFNEMMAPYESRGAIGAVLVELDEKSEGAALDVPYSRVIKLDSDLKMTEAEDFAFQLFVGVRAGNALLSYKGHNGDISTKIIHVHERELSFDANFYEDVENEKVRLYEEDLLSKEKNPLIISAEAVKQFATNKTASKINNHTYQTSFNRTLLGARKYLELGHQSEPVFVGYKDATKLDIPSESFMRYILSTLEGSKLGNRCLVQVNLKKKALKVDVGAESVASALMTHTQILDTDGKFYDSVSSKSSKIIVVGENQGAMELGQDGKINFKITYQDGTVDFLGSYCSPNSYLIEQL